MSQPSRSSLVRYGDLFASSKPYLVNPVNCVGVMGKGLAYQFRVRYPPDMMTFYRKACHDGTLKIGVPVVWNNPSDSNKNVILFPTKDDWRAPSNLEYITSGLEYYIDHLSEYDAAFPLLGAGLGGLSKDEVFEIMQQYLKNTECEIWLDSSKL